MPRCAPLPPLGSSPLARGTLILYCLPPLLFGLIPARAGNTPLTTFGFEAIRAHPRSRGEHRVKAWIGGTLPGSSPLARGTRCFRMVSRHGLGLIPARAGNTPAANAPVAQPGAHPRSRGEHIGTRFTGENVQGSSPLARGTLRQLERAKPHVGLIPARAGNTHRVRSGHPMSRAHPRSRGEHKGDTKSLLKGTGSSPLARGTPAASCRSLRTRGLIPARAGNTGAFHDPNTATGAHPRSRGEHTRNIHRMITALGSSPLARGTRGRCVRGCVRAGLIPARAGNTRR